jgi:dihydroneopterin aldolase
VIGFIELRGLRVSGLVGAPPEERQRRQPLEIDLDVATDRAEAAAGDRLDDTIDYGELCQRLDDVVATRPSRCWSGWRHG